MPPTIGTQFKRYHYPADGSYVRQPQQDVDVTRHGEGRARTKETYRLKIITSIVVDGAIRQWPVMQSSDLTRDQARALKNKLRLMLGYLGRLKRRRVRRGFPPDDPLLTAVVGAEDAVHALNVEVHYLSVTKHRRTQMLVSDRGIFIGMPLSPAL